MINISVKADIQAARVKLFELRTNVVNKATISALNKVAAQAKTASSKEIRGAGYNMKAAAIKKQISVRRASGSNPVALLVCKGRPIPLIEYSARQTAKGVTVSVKTGRKLIPGAFIATMNGHEGVYIRTGNQHKRVMRNGKPQWEGLPIKQLYGPAIPDAFKNDTVRDALIKLIKTKFPDILQHEIQYYGRR